MVGLDLPVNVGEGRAGVTGIVWRLNGCLRQGIGSFVTIDIAMTRYPLDLDGAAVVDLLNGEVVKLACTVLTLSRAQLACSLYSRLVV